MRPCAFIFSPSDAHELVCRYGEPNLKTIRELVYKRGYGKVRSASFLRAIPFPILPRTSATALNAVDACAIETTLRRRRRCLRYRDELPSLTDIVPQVNRQRVPLSSNAIIEENLGKYGILSIEDVVHEIATAGPHFREVSK